jgi:hypothetical protein
VGTTRRVEVLKGAVLGFETNPFAWFAIQLIRPAVTLTHSHPYSFGLLRAFTFGEFLYVISVL